MAKFTIATAKKALALAYPDIAFTYGKSGRGRLLGPSVSWTGGPHEAEIRKASGYVWEHKNWYFVRNMTDDERAVWLEQMDREDAARKAAEPARRAAAKADGIAKRAATLAIKKTRAALLREAFPTIEFDLSDNRVAWTDGPDVATIQALLDGGIWAWDRTVSPAEKARVIRQTRLQKRLAASKARATIVARAIVRRAIAHRLAARRQYLIDTQMYLPLFAEAAD